MEFPNLVGYVFTVSLFTLLIASVFVTQIQPIYAQVDINGKDNITDSNSSHNDVLLITKILAKNLENYLQKTGAILGLTSSLPQVRNVSYANFLNQTLDTLHGIPKDADIQKRQVAQSILSNYKDLQIIIFIMPNGDIYFDEPYSRQQASTTTNLAFRDYVKGVFRTNDTYLGDPTPSASSGQMQAVISIPVYSLKDNATIVGAWAGGIDFNVLNNELQSLNLTSDGKRVVYVGHNGQKVADSDINKSKIPESFADLNSFKNAINGESGSTIDRIGNTKMIVTYQPINAFHNTWVILLMQSNNITINNYQKQ